MTRKQFDKYYSLILSNNTDIKVFPSKKRGYIESFSNKLISMVCIGTKGLGKNNCNYLAIITTLLHEIGHMRERQTNVMKRELAAWRCAKYFAKKHNIPFDDGLMKFAVSSYRKSYKTLRMAIDPSITSKEKIDKLIEEALITSARENSIGKVRN